MNWLNRIHVGDCCKLMRAMIADGVRVQCIVTSPPYWSLRDYGVEGQIGLEATAAEHIDRLVEVFSLCRELLREDGLAWINYGDMYYSPRVGGGGGQTSTINGKGTQQAFKDAQRARRSRLQATNAVPVSASSRMRGSPEFKPKDLIGMPWRVALAAHADGWYLRSDIIWSKPNPMPESVEDRPTKSHEYLFMLSKSETYYSDFAAIREQASVQSHPHVPTGWAVGEVAHDSVSHSAQRSHTDGSAKAGNKQDALGNPTHVGFNERYRVKSAGTFSGRGGQLVASRNVRSVWNIQPEPFSGAHFATFPTELVKRCILASTRAGDVVFDPFAGSGTVAHVADSLGREHIGCELNPAYAAMYGTLRAKQMGMGV